MYIYIYTEVDRIWNSQTYSHFVRIFWSFHILSTPGWLYVYICICIYTHNDNNNNNNNNIYICNLIVYTFISYVYIYIHIYTYIYIHIYTHSFARKKAPREKQSLLQLASSPQNGSTAGVAGLDWALNSARFKEICALGSHWEQWGGL